MLRGASGKAYLLQLHMHSTVNGNKVRVIAECGWECLPQRVLMIALDSVPRGQKVQTHRVG